MCEIFGGPATTRCGRCGALPVCSKACLRSYWPEHKRVCQKQEPAVVNLAASNGATPISTARYMGHSRIVQLL